MSEQLDLLFGIEAIPVPSKADKDKRNWENAFQKWSNDMSQDAKNTDSYGHCGWGIMCDNCEDNSYGKPCVRALNSWCRDNRKTIDYAVRDFKKIWRGEL